MSLRQTTAYDPRFSREAFEPLNRGDATVDIPLQPVHNGPSHSYNSSFSQPHNHVNGHTMSEKVRPQSRGVRRALGRGQSGKGGYDEENSMNKLGKLYDKLLSGSIFLRYLIFILPLAAMFAIPMIIGATVGQKASLGGVRIVWIFMWLLVVWVGLWVSKFVAHYLPPAFQLLVGRVSPATRKYALMLRALEIPLSLAGAALVALSTFIPIMTRNPDTRAANAQAQAAGQTLTTPHWETVVQRILAATMISALIFLGERTFIQLISINYHRKQFALRIRDSKEQIRLLTLMYDASRAMFPAFCVEFAEEDAVISDTLDVAFSKRSRKGHKRSGSTTPLKLLRDVGRFGDKVTSVFGNVAHEITGKDVFNPTSANAVVVEALERNRSAEALAKRLWLSFVIEGHDALYMDDVLEVLGAGREADADSCFAMLDLDANGDVTLDEMIMKVTEMGRDRKSIANSMHDVDQAINVLDRMLCGVILIVIVFIYVAFLNTSFVTTLATAGTALLSLSFVFSVTCQEILGSCIFLFVKHPFDIGDRVDLSTGNDQLIVEHISLLFTVFRRVTNHRTVQIPNIVLNTLWVENVSRSKAMREQITIPINFDTTIEDVQLLRNELCKFVTDKDNSRDFQPDVEIEVQGVGTLDKLDLIIDVQHKSNWSNETLRAARRSKFMCALVLALRKVPIYGPGAGAPGLGEAANPHYYVAIADAEAARNKAEAAREKDANRLVPITPAKANTSAENKEQVTTRPRAESNSGSKVPLSPIAETRALETLNERSPAVDVARDDETERVEATPGALGRLRKGSEAKEIEEVRGLLHRATTKGRRKRGNSQSQGTLSPNSAIRPVPTFAEDAGHGLTNAYSAPPSLPPMATQGGHFGLARDGNLHGMQVPTQYTPLTQQSQQQPEHNLPLSTGHYDIQYPMQSQSTPDTHQNQYQLYDDRGLSVSESMDDFRGDYVDETEEQGRPTANAGTAYSAGQWRRGM